MVFDTLNPRQIELLDEIAVTGCIYKAAKNIGVGSETAYTQVHRLRTKLGLPSLLLVSLAYERWKVAQARPPEQKPPPAGNLREVGTVTETGQGYCGSTFPRVRWAVQELPKGAKLYVEIQE